MMDPYCGFNVRKGICEDVKSNANLVSLNTNICTRLFNTKNGIFFFFIQIIFIFSLTLLILLLKRIQKLYKLK